MILPVSFNTPGILPTTSPTVSSGGTLGQLPYVGEGLNILGGIIGKETVDKTIGQVLANGFNLKCWGSSRSPAKAKAELPGLLSRVKAMAEGAMNATTVAQLESNINRFYDQYYHIDIHGRYWLEKGGAKDCTREGLEMQFQGMDSFKDQVTKGIVQAVQGMGHTITRLSPEQKNYRAERFNRDLTIPTERFKLTAKTQSISELFGGKSSSSMGGGAIGIVVLGMIAMKLFKR